MIRLKVDEFTVVILLSDKDLLESHEWEDIAERIVSRVENDLYLDQILGVRTMSDQKNVSGYTKGFYYGDHPFYFRVCYHDAYWHMGVAIKFSAQSLAYYCTRYQKLIGSTIEVFQILQILGADFQRGYLVRLSRVDFCADFIDEGLSVNDLNEDLKDGKIHFEHSTGKKNTARIAFYTNDSIVDTIYIGSKKENIKTFLRIYNKRKEQIQQHGICFDEAVKCKDWVRMENSIRGAYAHDITQIMMKMDTVDELVTLICRCLLNKYTLVDENGADHKITALLRSAIKNPSDYYYSESKYKDYSLEKALSYLVRKSGLMPFLYKIHKIDPNAMTMFAQYLANQLPRYKPNWAVNHWMTAHEQYYREHGIHDVFETGKEEK